MLKLGVMALVHVGQGYALDGRGMAENCVRHLDQDPGPVAGLFVATAGPAVH